jgi:acetyl esterase/lipase
MKPLLTPGKKQESKEKKHFVFPSLSLSMSFKRQNNLLHIFLHGRWHGKKTQMSQKYIYRRDGSLLRVLIVWSIGGSEQNATGLLWLHGGAYASGIPEQDFNMMDSFCEDGKCVAVLPEYRLSGDAPYPAALEDAYLALVWMKEHAQEFGINPNQLFVGGESAGGGLAVALSLYARDRREVTIAFQMPLFPMIDDQYLKEKAKSYHLKDHEKARLKGWEQYLRCFKNTNIIPIYAIPARAKILDHLPPLCTIAGTEGPFYYETIKFAKRLKAADVTVYFRTFEGYFKVYNWLDFPDRSHKAAKQFVLDCFHSAQKNYFGNQPVGRTRKARSIARRRAFLNRRRRRLKQNRALSSKEEKLEAEMLRRWAAESRITNQREMSYEHIKRKKRGSTDSDE